MGVCILHNQSAIRSEAFNARSRTPGLYRNRGLVVTSMSLPRLCRALVYHEYLYFSRLKVPCLYMSRVNWFVFVVIDGRIPGFEINHVFDEIGRASCRER